MFVFHELVNSVCATEDDRFYFIFGKTPQFSLRPSGGHPLVFPVNEQNRISLSKTRALGIAIYLIECLIYNTHVFLSARAEIVVYHGANTPVLGGTQLIARKYLQSASQAVKLGGKVLINVN